MLKYPLFSMVNRHDHLLEPTEENKKYSAEVIHPKTKKRTLTCFSMLVVSNADPVSEKTLGLGTIFSVLAAMID